MDVVIPVGPDCASELRYCLRSIAAHMPTTERVWLVGTPPSWAEGTTRIDVPQDAHKVANSRRNLRTACEHPDVPEEFLLFNDDFFVMTRVDDVPVLHAGPLGAHYARVHARVGRSAFARMLHSTADLLHTRMPQDADVLSYALHLPMPVNKAGMLEAIAAVDGLKWPVSLRTVYGNLAGIGGTRAIDVKVATRDHPPVKGPFLSVSDRAWALYPVGRVIRAAFSEPCAFERPSSPGPVSRRGRVRKTAPVPSKTPEQPAPDPAPLMAGSGTAAGEVTEDGGSDGGGDD